MPLQIVRNDIIKMSVAAIVNAAKPAVEEETVAEPKKNVEAKTVERKSAINDEQRNRLMSNEANRFVYARIEQIYQKQHLTLLN